jgi:hypothetical protein
MGEYTTVQEVNDLLPYSRNIEKADAPLEEYITSGGRFDPTRASRLITKFSKVIDEAHGFPFEETTYTDEYHDIVGIPVVWVDQFPIISISSLSAYDGAQYLQEQEGSDRNTHDFYVEDSESGKVTFWEDPGSGVRQVKLTYKGGYATADIPGYVSEACALMVAIAILDQEDFDGECKEKYKKWASLVKRWRERLEYLIEFEIFSRRTAVATLGVYCNPGVVQELSDMVGCNDG